MELKCLLIVRETDDRIIFDFNKNTFSDTSTIHPIDSAAYRKLSACLDKSSLFDCFHKYLQANAQYKKARELESKEHCGKRKAYLALVNDYIENGGDTDIEVMVINDPR